MYRLHFVTAVTCIVYTLLRHWHLSSTPCYDRDIYRLHVVTTVTFIDYTLLRPWHVSTTRCYDRDMYRLHVVTAVTYIDYTLLRPWHVSTTRYYGHDIYRLHVHVVTAMTFIDYTLLRPWHVSTTRYYGHDIYRLHVVTAMTFIDYTLLRPWHVSTTRYYGHDIYRLHVVTAMTFIDYTLLRPWHVSTTRYYGHDIYRLHVVTTVTYIDYTLLRPWHLSSICDMWFVRTNNNTILIIRRQGLQWAVHASAVHTSPQELGRRDTSAHCCRRSLGRRGHLTHPQGETFSIKRLFKLGFNLLFNNILYGNNTLVEGIVRAKLCFVTWLSKQQCLQFESFHRATCSNGKQSTWWSPTACNRHLVRSTYIANCYPFGSPITRNYHHSRYTNNM